jgi:hypothetical protein
LRRRKRFAVQKRIKGRKLCVVGVKNYESYCFNEMPSRVLDSKIALLLLRWRLQNG